MKDNILDTETSSARHEQSLANLVNPTELAGRKVLIVVENLPVPFDRRVWMEARTLKAAGAEVSVICPKGKGFDASEEVIEGINVYRHSLPLDASGALGYLVEYGAALFHETRLTLKVWRRHGIDVIQGCNPPDLIFLVAAPLKLFGIKYIFDHHDINPELYEAKFNRRDFFWRLMCLFEKWTFKTANVSIATNQSYRNIAVERGGMKPDDVFIVRSGPDLTRLIKQPSTKKWHNGRDKMLGYVGVMGDQEGIDLLLESLRYLVKDKGREDIQLVLVGGGPSLEALKTLAADLELSDYVTFAGRAPDAELFDVLSNADVCVNPDRVNAMNDKSTMNKILEYMAFERPIVQFDVTEGRFSAGESSLYAKDNDTIDFALKVEELLGDPEACKRMGEVGRKRVETEMAWPFQIPSLLNAYKRALKIT
ncbi:glycosyltransferase family 4 protein [Pacificibacter marinus]|uniref:Putative glycosyltransferase EpsD n=1 Tax=Pacificibacter marinus TaxID=658057 RepID=A0A1Y5S3G4_9RHOB|nr:glycosyltransferase family 4 protein [Pacificibacter marinus]SEK94714.1 Glycosyltransferase involved in cell wall bisynthesis [Pacificibacter marinus]SLN29148.1 Putative glycosyltransferase EpsD [Pacificibacter marinus]